MMKRRIRMEQVEDSEDEVAVGEELKVVVGVDVVEVAVEVQEVVTIIKEIKH